MNRIPVICFVSCVKQKRAMPCAARDLYTSTWFDKARQYAESFNCPWYILSAKHGLVSPDTSVAPYERSLLTMPATERATWAIRVGKQLETVPDAARIVILAGITYRALLLPYFLTKTSNIEIPLEGLAIGQQLAWLSAHVKHPAGFFV